MARSTHFEDTSRDEHPHEFRRRVQDLMDKDQWQGIDYVGCDYPKPAEIIEIEAPEQQVIIKRRDAY